MRYLSGEEWKDWFDQIDDDANAMLALANAKCAEKFGTDATNPDRVLKLADILMQRHCAALMADATNEQTSKLTDIAQHLSVLSRKSQEK